MVLTTATTVFVQERRDTAAVFVRLLFAHCARALRASGMTPPEYFALIGPGMADQATGEYTRLGRRQESWA